MFSEDLLKIVYHKTFELINKPGNLEIVWKKDEDKGGDCRVTKDVPRNDRQGIHPHLYPPPSRGMS